MIEPRLSTNFRLDLVFVLLSMPLSSDDAGTTWNIEGTSPCLLDLHRFGEMLRILESTDQTTQSLSLRMTSTMIGGHLKHFTSQDGSTTAGLSS